LLGQGTTPYVHPFGVGLLLGLAYDTLEDGWHGSAVARSARFSYHARLFLKSTTADWARRHLRSGESVNGPALGKNVEGVPTITSTLLGPIGQLPISWSEEGLGLRLDTLADGRLTVLEVPVELPIVAR
jgi:hypothetical protein